MAYRIIGDSCCDYTTESGVLDFLTRVPLSIDLDGKTYIDDGTMDCTGEFLAHMRECPEAPKSACPSPESFQKLFEEAEGDVYVVTLSAKLSGSYGSAALGADLARENGCKNNIHVFDSESAAAGEIALCLKIKELADAGLPFAEVVEQGEAFVRGMTTLFALETLDVFRKNGRLSHLQALAVEALHLKMVMRGDRGQIAVAAKAMSTPRALKKMIEIVQQTCEKIDPKLRTLVITHINCRERAEMIRDKVLSVCSFAKAVICEGGGISTMYGNDGGIILAF